MNCDQAEQAIRERLIANGFDEVKFLRMPPELMKDEDDAARVEIWAYYDSEYFGGRAASAVQIWLGDEVRNETVDLIVGELSDVRRR